MKLRTSRTFPKKLSPTGIYLIPDLFHPQYALDLLHEIQLLDETGLPLLQPNTMNKYGCVLADIGMNNVFMELFDLYFKTLFNLLYPDLTKQIKRCHSFIVQYKMAAQTDLGFHYDESLITINLCLGGGFEGGDLYFKGLKDDPTTHDEDHKYAHIPGQAIVHQGQHRHGALPITFGSRYNLIVWYQS